MKLLEEKILAEGSVLPGEILKVDSFLNHQIDYNLFLELGKDFYEQFADKKITRILTLEVSGVAIAFAAATYFKVPLVFAKKIASKITSDSVYKSRVRSYTKGIDYDIKVDKKYLLPTDNVLIIDDFLARGEALKGLIDLCDQAGANVAAIGISIEKTFQGGGDEVRALGHEIYSQVKIKSLADNKVVFAD